MNRKDFKKRARQYALRVIRLVESLPEDRRSRILDDQLLRAGTSVGANYRSSIRAKSRADFISKMGTVEEECDESLYGMEVLIEAGKVPARRLTSLMQEGARSWLLWWPRSRRPGARFDYPVSDLRYPVWAQRMSAW